MMAQAQRGEIVVLSDLHIGRGRNRDTGRYYALEAFFYDDDFLQFCRYLARDAKERGVPLTVVLNGDVFDLLRIEPEATQQSAPLVERRYGAAHTPELAARMVRQIVAGHPLFIRAIAHLLEHHIKVVMLPGNHDIETQWEPVRDVLKEALRQVLSNTLLPEDVEGAMGRFVPRSWFYHEPGRVWIEHGCQYDPENAFRYQLRGKLLGQPERVFSAEQDVPLGNFFQRYLYNGFGHITFIVPSARANLRYLKWLLVNEPRVLASVFVSHVPFAIQVLRRIAKSVAPSPLAAMHDQELRELAQESKLGDTLMAVDKMKEVRADVLQATRTLGVQMVKAIGAILLAALVTFGGWFVGFLAINELSAGLGLKSILFLALNFVMLTGAGGTLAYSFFRHEKLPARPFQRAAQRLVELLDVPLVVFGHTHDEVVTRLNRGSQKKAWYFNTGTWIAVFTHDVLMPRERVQYTFLRIKDTEGELLQWSPGRKEAMQVILLDEHNVDSWGAAAPAPATTNKDEIATPPAEPAMIPSVVPAGKSEEVG